MNQEFYFKPIKYPLYLDILVFAIFFIILILFIIIINNPNNNIPTTIKNLILISLPLILLGKFIIFNRKISENTPLFIFNKERLIFNHPNKGFDIAWKDIEDINQSYIFNIPVLVIYTANKKFKIELKYFQIEENLNIFSIFKDYVMQYSGKKLIF